MKKLLVTCCAAVGLLMPMALNSTAQAEPFRERHLEIRETLHALENARYHLQRSAHDFGGHREAALRACDAAIEQLRLALQYDRD